MAAAAYDVDSGEATFSPKKPEKLVRTKGFRSVKQVAFAGGFGGQTTIEIGVRTKVPFRVSVNKGQSKKQRLVIDIARTR